MKMQYHRNYNNIHNELLHFNFVRSFCSIFGIGLKQQHT